MITNETILHVACLCKLSYNTQDEINTIFKNNMEYIDLQKHCENIPMYNESTNKNDCEVYTVIYKSCLVIIFRGTESVKDIMSDLNVIKTELQIHNTSNIEVHSGFFNQLNSVDQILKKQIKLFKQSNPTGSLIIGGHSLGGGVATIAALKYSSEFEIPTYCITFGSPRVGNSDFCKLFNDTIKMSIRVVNDDDPIPLVPCTCTYSHVHGMKWLYDNKILTKQKKFCKWVRFIRNFLLSCSTCCLIKAFDDHTMDNYIDDIENIETFKNPEKLCEII
jgi:triacylglycerol lipase